MPQLSRHSKSLAIMFAAAVVGAVAATETQDRVNPDGAAVKGFLDRTAAYAELQRKAEAGLPRLKPTEDASKLAAHKAALTARMRLARPDAKPGDIFGDATPLFRAAIRRDAEARSRRDASAALVEVPPRDPPTVNAAYPDQEALATVPPLLLAELPRLPDGLEYRFMGRDLILRDTKAGVIADILDRAIDPIRKR